MHKRDCKLKNRVFPGRLCAYLNADSPSKQACKRLPVKKLGFYLLALLFLASACSGPQPAAALDQVSVQLKWVHQAQFAGLYMAQEKGYYADENLQVTFIEGGPGIDIIDQVVSGQADFGIGAPEALFVRRSQGEPVLAIAVVFRQNPTVFVALADSGIRQPADMLGRRVAVAGALDLDLQLRAMMEKMGLDINQIELAPHTYDLTPLFNGEIDAIALYSTGGLIRMRQDGYEPNLIWPIDYGIHLYSDTIFTTDQMASGQAGLSTRFLSASLRGWRAAIENPEQAVAVTLKFAQEADAELQTEMMAAIVPLVHTGQDQIGWMQPQIWQEMHDLLNQFGLLAAPLSVGDIYTMQFLEEVYGDEK